MTQEALSDSDPVSTPPQSGAASSAFIDTRIRPKYPDWDGNSFDRWTPTETAGMVRAVVQDYLEDHGYGHDWQEAATQAQLVMCGIYNDIVNFRTNGQPAGHEYDLRLTMNWPGREEAFEVLLMRASEHLLAPLPLPQGGVFERELGSVVGQASARAVAPFDCMKMPDEGILALLDQIAAYLGGKNNLAIMLAAAMLVRWKGCQVVQVIQGGAVYRQIKNPEYAQFQPADARILYARTGPHLERQFQVQGGQSNVVVLA